MKLTTLILSIILAASCLACISLALTLSQHLEHDRQVQQCHITPKSQR